MADVAALQQILSRCPPRSVEVLLCAQPGPQVLAGLAAHYATGDDAAARLLLRAARDFRFAAEGRPVPARPLPDADEAALARALADALSGQAAGADVTALAEDVTALASHAEALRERLAAAAAEAERSPAGTRELWLRRLAIALILALTAWSWWRDRHAPPPPGIPRANLPR